jgi:hypothetical protein
MRPQAQLGLRQEWSLGSDNQVYVWIHPTGILATFARVASGTETEVLRTPYGVAKANVICERFLGSMRQEYLDYFRILSERHLYRVTGVYFKYFNKARRHQGIKQRVPCQPELRSGPQPD